MATVTPAEKLSDLQEARRHAENLSYYRQKHQEVPSIDAEEMLELYTAIEQIEDMKTFHGLVGGILADCRAQETKPSTAETPATAEETKPLATDLDSVAERILGAFKSEDDTRTDADLLAASGLKRDEYLDIRDFLLIETEEISETAEDTAPTEYIRNFPRTVQAAA